MQKNKSNRHNSLSGIISVMNTDLTSSRRSGFTVIELVVVAVVFLLAGVLVYGQINKLKVAEQDSDRKVAINAMYYALEEVYYKKHKSYPSSLSADKLPSVDPALFTDPDGFTLGKESLSEEEVTKLLEEGSGDKTLEQRLASLTSGKGPNYHYEGTNCDTDGNCKSYTLRADLTGEAQYVKKSRNS